MKPYRYFRYSSLLLLVFSGALGGIVIGNAPLVLAQGANPPGIAPPVEGNTPNSPFLLGLNSKRTLIAQNRAFALLAQRAGYGQEPVPPAEEPPANWLGWMIGRYQGALLPPGREETMDGEAVAALVHQDLQRVRLWLQAPDAGTRTKALKMGGMALLYARSLDGSGGIGDKNGSFPSDELRAAISEGFLIPFLSYAPTDGPGSRRQVLEGVSTIYRDLGRTSDQRQVLRLLAGTQASPPYHGPEADVARVHLVDALVMGVPPLEEIAPDLMERAEAEGYERDTLEALSTLWAVTTPDLQGAKARLPEIEEQHSAIRAKLLAWNKAGEVPGAGNTPGVPGAGGGNGAGTTPGTAQQPPTIGGLGAGKNQGGAGGDGGDEGGDAGSAPGAAKDDAEQARLDEEQAKADTPAGRAKRAFEAAQKAAAATRRAQRLSAMALSLAGEAAQAHQALAMARAPKVAARPAQTPANEEDAVPDGTDDALRALAALPLPQLERRVYDTSRAASDAARRADEATVLAQKATARARNLCLLVRLSSNVNRAAAPVAAPVQGTPAQGTPAQGTPAQGAPAVKEAR